MATPPKTTVDKAAKWDENDEDEITDEDFEDMEPPKPPADEEGWMNETEIMEDILEQYDAEEEAKEKAKKEKGDHRMATSDYFDTRALTPPVAGRAHVCPVGSCKAALRPPESGKGMPLCPIHKIKVHRTTFVYQDPARNIRFEQNYFRDAILNNKPSLKAETYRLGYENSEDALTWNVFTALARRGQLSTFLRRLFPELDVSGEPELYLWGLKISLDGPVPKEQFDALCSARKVFESGIHKMNTEPDIMLYAPNRFLILVEAKFTSPNTTVRPGATDRPEEKPKTRKGILERYKLAPGSLLTPSDETPLFSQLYRNLVFAIYMAKQLNVQWGVVNLTSRLPAKKLSELTAFSNAVLPAESRQRFVRYTWEQLFRDHVEGKDSLDELATYLRFKSANRGRAFDI